MSTPGRATQIGRLVKEWRLDRGLNRPETVNEMSKLGVDTTPDYLNKLESGTRSLASASLEIREALRTVLGITRSEWEDKTGLHVPLPESRLEAIPVVRSTRTAPAYRLTVSGGKGRIVQSDAKIYINEDWEGEFDAYVLETSTRYRTTVIVRRQTSANKGDEVIGETLERGVFLAEVVAVVNGTYFLKGDFEPFETDDLAVRGVVVRKQEDRLAN